MKPWQTPLNKAPSQAKLGKEGTKRENSTPKFLSQKDKTQSGSLRGKGTNHVQKVALHELAGQVLPKVASIVSFADK
jgi:hypothetical protein